MQPNPFIKYFRWRIDGDDYVDRSPSWGRSAIYMETSEEGFVGRQIQLFESGVVLAYDGEHYHDDYGWRYPNPVYTDPPRTVPITSKEFHRVWLRHTNAKNREPIQTAQQAGCTGRRPDGPATELGNSAAIGELNR